MPSYFYHVVLELLTSHQPNLQGSSLHHSSSSTSSNTRTSDSLAFDSACEALLPFQKRLRHSSRPGSSGKSRCSTTTTLSPRSSPTATADSQTDPRLDKIFIECIDMVAPTQDPGASKRASTTATTTSSSRHSTFSSDNPIATGIGTEILGGLRTRGKYTALDHRSSDSVWGVVHLYRDAQETPYLADDDYGTYLSGSAAARHGQSGPDSYKQPRQVEDQSRQSHLDEECTTLCILAVPWYLSPPDFLGLVGQATLDDVSHFRMIRTARANRYMCLMKFRSAKKAREWQKEWNGRLFNNLEPETCHVVFVKTVEIQTAQAPVHSGSSTSQAGGMNTSHASSTTQRATSSASLSSKPPAPPTPALVELPTCPVCLERMDETSGLLTILCQHVFHCTCLQKWKGNGCPVCRYTQAEIRHNSQGGYLGEELQHQQHQQQEGECSVCHSEANLWMCLICGSIGCGRYDGAHAFDHYKTTGHAFAIDLSTQRVWDYVGDAYVHRIIQSKTDGKLVELPGADPSALDPPDWTDAVPREKLDNMSLEYTHLLTSQLESQRAYFEEIVERAADKASRAGAAATAAQEAADTTTSRLQEVQAEFDKLSTETVPAMERDRARAAKRADKFEGMARRLEKEWREEKTINESLMQRVDFLAKQVEQLQSANADLTEQNRDLTFFISGSERLKGQSEDVVQGTVTVAEKKGKKR
ncbi:hypothetical protein ASPZODRAFT_72244 [Penicilliopsis zonata CBS 506.65]|uniref:RING-type domain-containing protein n=1 Tax=Penicilliopsis zonata CBS 506.65 TaxID=1073090 RepID=A0A1L9SA64_9EURO|nr:hypothetical protein ASPZODRAFT_72244 [Penicilliopsis zonata CBS 506.65]OJJ44072.1 hypothetical protein ASPZODRAFT_72244 [Penicilliopsis zonata CBS 506.65]